MLEGFFFQTGMAVTDASLVLAVLFRQLGASTAVIGILQAIRFAGWSLPQILVANLLESRRWRMPVYLWGNGVRFPMYFAMGLLVAWLAPTEPGWAIALLLVIYTAGRIAAGIAAAARSDIEGKIIAPEALSSFFAWRNLVGNVGGFATGFLIKAVLGEGGLPYPWNFAALLALSGLLFGAAWLAFAQVKEPPSAEVASTSSLAGQFAGIRELLRRDANFKQYLIVRILLSFVRVVNPFYALYAIDKLDVAPEMVGTYMSVLTFAHFIANPLWGWVGRKWGSVTVLRFSALLSAAAPLIAVAIPLAGIRSGWIHLPLFAYLYGVVYVAAGIAETGDTIAGSSYILTIAPTERRPTYIGLTNAVRGAMDLLTIASGGAIDLWGYGNVFAAAAALIAAGAGLSWRLQGAARDERR